MSIDTTALDTSLAVVPDLAWSLDSGDVVDFPEDLPEPDNEELAPVGRYSWWLVWLRAVLLVMVATALGAGIVFVMRGWHAPAPAAAPQSTSPDTDAFLREAAGPPFPDDPSRDPEVCAYIRAGHSVQEAVEAGQDGGAVPLEFARAYVTTAINAYCPEISASAAPH
jgi:hypothetical protein